MTCLLVHWPKHWLTLVHTLPKSSCLYSFDRVALCLMWALTGQCINKSTYWYVTTLCGCHFSYKLILIASIVSGACAPSDMICSFSLNERGILIRSCFSQVSVSLTWICQTAAHANQALLLSARSRSLTNQEIECERAGCFCLRGINWIKVWGGPRG